jgi:phosphoserine phosphatase RsbU/P
VDEKPFDNRWYLLEIARLQKQLVLQQSMVAKLLNITQAINFNDKAIELYRKYKSFLLEDLSINRFGLLVLRDKEWMIATSHDADRTLWEAAENCIEELQALKSPYRLHKAKHPFLKQFHRAVVVKHKANAISYLLVGQHEDKTPMATFEIQILSALTNILAVANENKRLYKRQLDQERLANQMRLAGDMQKSLVSNVLPNTADIAFASIFQPHDLAGGDFYDIHVLEDRIVFYLADIAGKGIDAAILAASSLGVLRVLSRQFSKDLERLIREANTILCDLTQGERFLTLFIGSYCTETRVLEYVNAGHPQPMLVANGGMEYLDKGTTILGMIDRLKKLEVGRVDMPKDALLLTFTDGLTDITNGELSLEEAGLFDFVLGNADLTPAHFNDKLLAYISNFKGNKPYPDDLTVLTGRL